MRTDSTNLSDFALETARATSSPATAMSTTSAGLQDQECRAQEAHEAIRPTDMTAASIKVRATNADCTTSSSSGRWRARWPMRHRKDHGRHSPARPGGDARRQRRGHPVRRLHEGVPRRHRRRKGRPRHAAPHRAGPGAGLEAMQAIESSPAHGPLQRSCPCEEARGTRNGRPSTYASTIGTIQKRGYVVKRTAKARSGNSRPSTCSPTAPSVRKTTPRWPHQSDPSCSPPTSGWS